MGRQVIVRGAGVGGAEFVTTIETVTNATTIELADAPVTTVAGVDVRITTAGIDLARAVPLDIASQWKPGQGAAQPFRAINSVVLPFLNVEQVSYRFGLRDNASQSVTLRGDSIFYNPGPAYVQEVAGAAAVHPKRGDEIFEGTDYPRTWDGFVGQERAKEQLMVQVASAKARGRRIEHTLLASGTPGVGKSTLAAILAYQAGAGIVQVSGDFGLKEALQILPRMRDGDVLWIDEVHLLVSGNRNKADWLLPWMTEGVLYTERGGKKTPDVALVAATTDAGKLPEALLSRFMVQPILTPYSRVEAAAIVRNLAHRMGVEIPGGTDEQIAVAASRSPRTMRRILTAVRDLAYAFPESHPNLARAFEYAGGW